GRVPQAPDERGCTEPHQDREGDNYTRFHVRSWCNCGCRLEGHGRLVHCLADGQEDYRDQPVPSRHHGRRRGRLSVLGARTWPPMQAVRALKQGAHQRCSGFQATLQHGLLLQGHGPIHGYHGDGMGQDGPKPVLRGQRRTAAEEPPVFGRLRIDIRVRRAGRRLPQGSDARGGHRLGQARHLPCHLQGRVLRRLCH
ncbi:hypothetical protein HK405_000330, partial [Cladochytrium tenue]